MGNKQPHVILRCQDGGVEIPANTIRDGLAVHRSPSGKSWCVSHVPSGLRIAFADSCRDARNIMLACLALPLAWVVMRPEQLREHEEEIRGAVYAAGGRF